jgi:hypothetical protein
VTQVNAGTTIVVVDWEGRAVGQWLEQSKYAAYESIVPKAQVGWSTCGTCLEPHLLFLSMRL